MYWTCSSRVDLQCPVPESEVFAQSRSSLVFGNVTRYSKQSHLSIRSNFEEMLIFLSNKRRGFFVLVSLIPWNVSKEARDMELKCYKAKLTWYLKKYLRHVVRMHSEESAILWLYLRYLSIFRLFCATSICAWKMLQDFLLRFAKNKDVLNTQ